LKPTGFEIRFARKPTPFPFPLLFYCKQYFLAKDLEIFHSKKAVMMVYTVAEKLGEF
jgi:hypothetical protein